jgi:hypothetical protein
MGKLTVAQKSCLRFAREYWQGWQGFSTKVNRTVRVLERKGLLLVNDFSQFKISEQGKVFAYQNL